MRSRKQPDLSELHPLERGRERERYMNLPEGAKFVYTSTTSRPNLLSSNPGIGFRCSLKNMAIQVKMLLYMRGTSMMQEHRVLCCNYHRIFAAFLSIALL